MFVLPLPIRQAVFIAALNKLSNPGGSGNLLQIRLFTNLIIPSNKLTVADFTEVTALQVPGYVHQNFSWLITAGNVPGGDWIAAGSTGQPTFVASADAPLPVTVYGWFAKFPVGPPALLGSGLFDVPFVFSRRYDACVLDAYFRGHFDDDVTFRLIMPDFQPVS